MSSTVVNDGTARQLVEPGHGPLRARILSALVLLPVAVAAIVSGTPYFEIFVIIAAVAMCWEWTRLCGAGRFAGHGYLFMAIIVLASAAAALRRFDLAAVVAVMGAAAIYYAARVNDVAHAPWTAAGVFAVGLPVISLIWIEAASPAGWHAVMWLFGAVWATDIGAYGIGWWIGGARLAPSISPKKTWSGLIGGMLCAMLWSVIWGWWLGAPSLVLIGFIGALTAVIAQAGDLGVSMVKRRFGVKDASSLIPGHGGVLDRLDGVISSAPALAALLLVTEGNRAPWLIAA